MARLEINRLGEMEVFTKAVEFGNFSAASRHFEMTPSAVSKLISRLEQRLNVRLFNRSTRQLQLTAEGQVFYEASLGVLNQLELAEQTLLSSQQPSGKLRVTTNTPIAHHFILPILTKFLRKYPQIEIDLSITDTVVDLIRGSTDIAIRSGPMKDSSLTARKLGETSMMLVASPAYLKRYGTPSKPADLKSHNLLGFNFLRKENYWLFKENRELVKIRTLGNIKVSDGESLRQLVLTGAGLARLASFQVKQAIAKKKLVAVLEEYCLPELEALHAVFLGQGNCLPMRVRVFLDFLIEEVQLSS
jgi:DNA-binding transcriptional LysR family regulator